MACNVVRKEDGQIQDVYTNSGSPSNLYSQINDVIKDKDAAYAVYLELLYKAEKGQLNSLGNFVPKNNQGEINISINPKAMSIVAEASQNISKYKYKALVLENEHRKGLLEESLKDFLNTMKIPVSVVEDIHDRQGNKLDITARADLLNRVIEITKNKKGEDTLPEEAAHFFVEFLKADMNPLYNSMYTLIENYEEFKEISDPSGFYYERYNGNIDMLKREAIGKVIAKHILKKDTLLNSKETDPSKLSRLQRWWEKVMNFLNTILGRAATDPFLHSAQVLLNNRLEDVLKSDPSTLKLPSEVFYQETSNTELTPLQKLERDARLYKQVDVSVESNPYFQKLSENGETQITRYMYVGPTTESLTTGDVITKRMSDKAALRYKKRNYTPYDSKLEAYNKAWSKVRLQSGTRVHSLMERLVNSYTGNSQETIAEIQNEYTEYNTQQFLKLSLYANNLIKEIKNLNNKINKEEGTKGGVEIRTEMFLMNRKEDVGGTMDLIAFFADGSAAIYDYKSKIIDLTKAGAYIGKNGKVKLEKDIFLNNKETYSLQMGEYKNTLLKQYGVSKIRQSRIIPILLQYKTDSNGFPLNKVNDIQLGVEDNPFLAQIPVAEEKTFIANIDKLVTAESRRLKMLMKQEKGATFAQKKRLAAKIKISRRILQRLQLDKNVDLVITESTKLVKRVNKALKTEEKTLKDGSFNVDYMNEEELLSAYNELKHFNNFTAIQELVTVYKKRGESEKAEELKNMLQVIGYDISNVIIQIQQKMVERLVDLAKKEGVNSIDTFNRRIGKLTADWVSRSNQSHPALRFIHKLKRNVEDKLVEVEKDLASEIATIQEDLFAWGRNNDLEGPIVYDALINSDTMSLHSRFNNQFMIDKKRAIEKRDINWFKTNYIVDEELYTTQFEFFKQNAFKLIDEEGGGEIRIQKSRANWLKKFDPNLETSWLNPTNPFIKITDNNAILTKYLSEDYMRIQTTPALKNFYDFYKRKTKEFLDIMGIRKDSNYIADIHKNLMDELIENGWNFGNLTQSMLDKFQMREHEQSFGETDLDGNFIRHIPRYHTVSLQDSEGNPDPSLKSKELGKSLYLLGSAAYNYKYLNEIAPELLMMEALYREGIIEEIAEDKKGSLVKEGSELLRRLDKTNAETITEFIDAELFGQNMKTLDKIISVGGKDVSMLKSVVAIKGFHTVANLGLRQSVAMAAFGAGFIGLFTQGSKNLYYDNTDIRFGISSYFSKDPKLRALFEYFDITLEDLSGRRADLLSSTTKGKLITGDRWFELLARADRTLDSIITVAMARNYGVHPETGKLDLLKYLPEGTVSIYDSVEFKENPKWTATGVEDRYITTVPGVLNKGEGIERNNWGSFREKVDTQGSKVKGAVKQTNRYNSQNKLINRLFIHYRSWLPGLALERMGRLRYDYVMENFEQGTWRSLWGNIGEDKPFKSFEEVVNTEFILTEVVKNVGADILRIGADITTFGAFNLYDVKENKAKLEFEKFIAEQEGQSDFEYNTKEEKEEAFKRFVDMKRANIKAGLAEIRAVLLLMISIMMLGADWDDDGKKDIRQTWAGRQLYSVLNRTYREVAVFYDWTELTGPRASGIPLMSFGSNIIKLAGNFGDEMFDSMFGEDDNPDKSEKGKYTFKFVPGLNGLVKFAEIYEKTQ